MDVKKFFNSLREMDLEDMDVSTTVQVACLSNICDLEEQCAKQKMRLSKETNRFLLFLTVKRLGLANTQNLMKKCQYSYGLML